MSMVSSWASFQQRTVTEAIEQATRGKAAEEQSKQQRLQALEGEQRHRLLAAVGPELMDAMQRDGFKVNAEVLTDNTGRPKTDQDNARVQLVIVEPLYGAQLHVYYDPTDGMNSPRFTCSYRVYDNSGAGRGWQETKRDFAPDAMPRMVALMIDGLQKQTRESKEQEAQRQAEADQRRLEEEEHKQQLERNRQRDRAFAAAINRAKQLEDEAARWLREHFLRELQRQQWQWPKGFVLKWYVLRWTAGGFRTEDGEDTFNEHKETMLDPNCHDGRWGFIRQGKLVPTQLVNTPPVWIEEHQADRPGELPPDLREMPSLRVRGIGIGEDSHQYRGSQDDMVCEAGDWRPNAITRAWITRQAGSVLAEHVLPEGTSIEQYIACTDEVTVPPVAPNHCLYTTITYGYVPEYSPSDAADLVAFIFGEGGQQQDIKHAELREQLLSCYEDTDTEALINVGARYSEVEPELAAEVPIVAADLRHAMDVLRRHAGMELTAEELAAEEGGDHA